MFLVADVTDWVGVCGVVTQGYGVASGKAQDPRFPEGTIAMQIPFFRDLGLDLSGYFPGTLNLSIAPQWYRVKQPRYTFRHVKWCPEPAEDFSFFDCRIMQDGGQGNGMVWKGLIYYPHPETKPEHFQSPDLLEVLVGFIPNLAYGDRLRVELDDQQIEIMA